MIRWIENGYVILESIVQLLFKIVKRNFAREKRYTVVSTISVTARSPIEAVNKAKAKGLNSTEWWVDVELEIPPQTLSESSD